jgi:hypothetical protein
VGYPARATDRRTKAAGCHECVAYRSTVILGGRR